MAQKNTKQGNLSPEQRNALQAQESGQFANCNTQPTQRKKKKGSTNQDLRQKLAALGEELAAAQLENKKLKQTKQIAQYITPTVKRCIELYKEISELDDKCYKFCEKQFNKLICEDAEEECFKDYKRRFSVHTGAMLKELEKQIGEEIGETVIFGD